VPETAFSRALIASPRRLTFKGERRADKLVRVAVGDNVIAAMKELTVPWRSLSARARPPPRTAYEPPAPVISVSSLKKPRLRAEPMRQSHGTD